MAVIARRLEGEKFYIKINSIILIIIMNTWYINFIQCIIESILLAYCFRFEDPFKNIIIVKMNMWNNALSRNYLQRFFPKKLLVYAIFGSKNLQKNPPDSPCMHAYTFQMTIRWWLGVVCKLWEILATISGNSFYTTMKQKLN